MPFDRDLLLLGSKRNQVLSLDEIHQYGIDSYQDPDYVYIYGLRPAQTHAMGIRMLGRTAVESRGMTWLQPSPPRSRGWPIMAQRLHDSCSTHSPARATRCTSWIRIMK